MEQLRPQTLSIQPEPTRLENEAYTARIRELNDTFRSGGRPGCEKLGRKMMTSGIRGLGLAAMVEIASMVAEFTDFEEGNDPFGEHDFGAFDYQGHSIFWKIDYYDRECLNGSPDPTNPDVTCRVLTIYLADEH